MAGLKGLVAVVLVVLTTSCTEVDMVPDTAPTSTTAAPTPTSTSAPATTVEPPTPPEVPLGIGSIELGVDPGEAPLDGRLFVSAEGIARAVYVAGESRIDLAICVDMPCTSVITHQVVDTAPAVIGRLVATGFDGAGAPVVVYAAFDGGDFINAAAWCDDPDCAETGTKQISRNADGRRPLAAAEPSFGVSPDGRCFGVSGYGDIYLAECTDGYRVPGSSEIVVSSPDLGPAVLGFGSDGQTVMVIEQQEGPASNVAVLACADIGCSEPGGLQQIFAGEVGVPLRAHPPLVSGSHVTIFIELTSSEGQEGAERFTPARLIAIGCDDLTCSSPRGGIIESFVQASASAVGDDGLPRLAWTDRSGGMAVLGCEDAECSSYSAELLDVNGFLFDMAVAGDRFFFLVEDGGRLSIITWTEDI